MVTTIPARSLTTAVMASGVLLFVCLLGGLEGVDGLASKSTYYYDDACERGYGSSSLIFGFPDLDTSAVLQGFNECSPYSDDAVSVKYVCDATTGETGLNSFADGTCTRMDYERAAAPSCVKIMPGEECDGSGICSLVTECTDDVASTITPNAINFLAIEYSDADCTEPTGNTEIVSSGSEDGGVSGECFEISPGTGYSTGECRADGSYIVQTFLPEDDKCSGDVWVQTTSPTEFLPPLCSAVAVDGLYYGYVSCTTDAATVWMVTTAPAAEPSPTNADTDDEDVTTPSPTTNAKDDDGDAAKEAPSPTTNDNEDTGVETPVVSSDDFDDDAAAAADDTPAPAAIVGANDDVVGNTSAPTADGGSRGITITASPTVGVEETASPTGNDDNGLSSGAVAGVGGGGGGVAVVVASAALSCAVGILVTIAM